MRILIAFLLVLTAGCGHLQQLLNHSNSTETIDPVEAEKRRAAEQPVISQAEKALAEAKFQEAQNLFVEFQKKYPHSVFFQSARLGEAQCQEGLGHYQEAAELYRDIFYKTNKDHPEIAALALYRMAFAYEALGDDLKTVAALLDAKNRSESLPLEVAQAQIPARLAAVYARQNRDKEALAYLNEAEKGITKVIAAKGKEIKPDWLAKIYFEMGSISTNQLTVENFEDFARGQKIVQVYLIKAMKQSDDSWSKRAQARLEETYRDLYTYIETGKGNRALQSQNGGALVDLMDQAELFKPLAGQKANTYEQAFFNYLDEVRKKTEIALYGSKESMTLTEESQKLNALKRAGRIQSGPVLPEEQNSTIPLPPKVVPSEDPNL